MPRTGLSSGGITVYYCITYNPDGGGETGISNILSATVNKSVVRGRMTAQSF